MKSTLHATIDQLPELILAAWEAGEMPCIIGPPGIGKTDVCADAARLYGATHGVAGPPGAKADAFPFFARSLATMTAEDFVVPDRDPASGHVLHKPVGAFRVACERPAVTLLDEQNRCSLSTQNGLLCLIQSRIVGDWKLHPDSRLIGAMNDVDDEGGDGAHERLTALADRQIDIRVEASFAGWFDYATKRIGADGSSLRALAVDYAYSADRSPSLLSLRPLPGVEKRPSPRAIAKGLAVYDAALRRNLPEESAFLLLAGAIGEEAAGCFKAINKIRRELPSKDEIKKDPLSARLPRDLDVAIGVMGLLGVVASEAPDAAWLYLGRMTNVREIQVATGRSLIRGAKPPRDSRAVEVKNKLLGVIGLAGIGQAVGLSW